MFKVIGTDTYLNEISGWERADKEVVDKLPLKLSENPFSGSPLNYPFLREKRAREKRVYYLIYKDLKLVLLVAVSGKKNQQTTINHIRENLNLFSELAKNIVKQVS